MLLFDELLLPLMLVVVLLQEFVLTVVRVSLLVATVVVAVPVAVEAVGVGVVVFDDEDDVFESLECSEALTFEELVLLAEQVDETNDVLGEVDDVGVIDACCCCWLFVAVGVVTANIC